MWHETNSQKDGTIQRNTHFAESPSDLIYSGPNITIANATFKSARRKCSLSSDYDPVDLTQLSDDFLPRCNYSPKCSIDEYFKRVSITPWNTKYCKNYRIIMRRMLSQGGERTLVPAICPPLAGHIHTVFGLTAQDKRTLALLSAEFESVIMDCFIKITRKYDVYFSTISNLPIVYGFLENQLIARTLLLNCVTKYYNSLWSDCWNNLFVSDMWSKSDPRLDNKRFSTLTSEWTWDTPLRTDYERRPGTC